MDFEKKIGKIEEITEKMEKGNLSLDENIDNYKKGKALIKECHDFLNESELLIETLDENS